MVQIFQCHIEDVGSLETDTFIQALRRFMNVRGAAKEIWSDNSTNFTGGEKELRLAMREWNQLAISNCNTPERSRMAFSALNLKSGTSNRQQRVTCLEYGNGSYEVCEEP